MEAGKEMDNETFSMIEVIAKVKGDQEKSLHLIACQRMVGDILEKLFAIFDIGSEKG